MKRRNNLLLPIIICSLGLIFIVFTVIIVINNKPNETYIEQTGGNDMSEKEKAQLKLNNLARLAYTNVINNFWDANKDFFKDPYKDFGRDTLSDIMWVYGQLVFSLETYYKATGDENVKTYIAKQMDAYYNNFSEDWLLAVGCDCNPALDDAAWSCMTYMVSYRLNGDEKALDYCHKLLIKSFDYWQDEDTSKGCYYRLDDSGNPGHDGLNTKTLYAGGLLTASFDYYEATKGTDKEDKELFDRTLNLYNWMENNLRRDDNLYYCDYIDNKETGECHPKEGTIEQTHSCSALFGNTSMAVINKRLYEMTGDTSYLDKAVSTANALEVSEYNYNETIRNDRDAWTNTAFLGYFVSEVLPLSGVDKEVGKLILNTAVSIMKTNYFEGGFYGADWTGDTTWLNNGQFGIPTYLTINATTTHVIYSSLLAYKNGSIEFNEETAEALDFEFEAKPLAEENKRLPEYR